MREVWKIMEDVSYFSSPSVKGEIASFYKFTLPSDCAMDENLGCCSIPAFCCPGCPQAASNCLQTAETLLISYTRNLATSCFNMTNPGTAVEFYCSKNSSRQVGDRPATCLSRVFGKTSPPHMPDKLLKHKLNMNLKKAAVFWRTLPCTWWLYVVVVGFSCL